MAKLSKNGKKGAVGMGESGKKDKGKKEQKKKPKLTIKEKRKLKKEKHNDSSGILKTSG